MITSLMNAYRQQLKRIAWRIQYRARVEQQHETFIPDDYLIDKHSSDIDPCSELIESELLDLLTAQERYIIKRIVLEGYTESEVALQLKISQQAVNKCKQRALIKLRKMKF